MRNRLTFARAYENAMHRSLLDILVDPVSKTSLQIETSAHEKEGEILEGRLKGSGGRWYAVSNGIPRFVLTEDADQKQTGRSFGFKWRHRETYESSAVRSRAQEWLVRRYGFESLDGVRDFFGRRKGILDAGCGSGFSSSLWLNPLWRREEKAGWCGLDISTAIDVARERLGDIPGTSFIQGDILQLPFREGSFDTVFSEGVLHHTPSTEAALKSLVPLLESEGQMLFYIYRKKAPIRELTDDHIRGIVSALAPEEAWRALYPLTKLGQALSELHAEVEIQEEIPYLGIKAGRYDLQRLIYWYFVKLFWDESCTFDENHHVNFDWYHPRYAHRHTEEEIRRWCNEAGLSILHFHGEESGFTVRATKG
jgi:arsenite methyltransferase